MLLTSCVSTGSIRTLVTNNREVEHVEIMCLCRDDCVALIGDLCPDGYTRTSEEREESTVLEPVQLFRTNKNTFPGWKEITHRHFVMTYDCVR